MSSTCVVDPPEVTDAVEALNAAVAGLRGLDFDQYEPAVRLRALEHLETSRREQAVATHDLIGSLAKEEPPPLAGRPTR